MKLKTNFSFQFSASASAWASALRQVTKIFECSANCYPFCQLKCVFVCVCVFVSVCVHCDHDYPILSYSSCYIVPALCGQAAWQFISSVLYQAGLSPCCWCMNYAFLLFLIIFASFPFDFLSAFRSFIIFSVSKFETLRYSGANRFCIGGKSMK